MNPLGVQDSEKGEEGANLPSPGFAGMSSELAAQAYRNDTSAATSRQFSLSRPTHESQWGLSMPARQQSANPFPAMARRLQNRFSGHQGFESACQGWCPMRIVETGGTSTKKPKALWVSLRALGARLNNSGESHGN